MYKKYGARIHFDENQVVSAIYECDSEKLYLPGEPGWEEAKLVAKSAVFTLCTVREHLAQTHLIVSNAASREIVLNLHPEHPIRRLLAIFTYNAVSINLKAFGVLVPENCAIHRGTPLDYKEGFRPVFDNAYATSRAFEPFSKQTIKNPTLQKLADEGRFPYLTEGSETYEIMRKMVTEWLAQDGDAATDEYALNFYEAMRESTKGQDYELPEYSHENMIDMISMVCFTVTCFHELIGTVPDYTDSPFKAGLRIPKSNPTQIDFQATLIGYTVTASTSVPAPKLLAEFPNYIGAGGAPAWERDVWTNFCADLTAQSEKVKAADEARDFEFNYFDPARFECSVSV